MKSIIAPVLLFAAAAVSSAQCVVFLVPPDVPIYTAEDGTDTWRAVREDYALAFPFFKMAWKLKLLVKIAEAAPIPVRAACFPEEFKRSKDSKRVRVRILRGESGESLEAWVQESESVPVVYDAPTWSVTSQNAAENLRAIHHAADLKLDSIRNASFKPPEVENQKTFAADFDKAWSALIETLSDQKWQIESIDKGSGLVTTKPAIDKGGATMACATKFDEEHKTWLNVFAKKTDAGTRVKINATFRAMREDQSINCYSNGTIESEIFKGIQENLK